MVENRVADHAKESNVQFAVHNAGLTLEEGAALANRIPKALNECTQLSKKSLYIDSTEKAVSTRQVYVYRHRLGMKPILQLI